MIPAKPRWLATGVLGVLSACLWGAGPAMSMPNFARQYEVDCTYCHTVIPKLTRDGYNFRRAGFRLVDEIDQNRDLDGDREGLDYSAANYASARIQMNSSYVRRDDSTPTGGFNPVGDSYDTNQIEFKEFTLYPLTGAFLGNWAAESEISGGTDEIEVENAYLRFVDGDESFSWGARAGIFHPFEGFGASDRPLGLSRPLIQSVGTMNASGEVNGFHPWGFDQSGIEVDFTGKNTSVSLAVFNGIIENADDPAQGGKLKKAAGSPTQDDKDFQFFANQFLGNSDAAVSAYYYNGRISLGDPVLYENRFQRYAVYATVPVQKVNLLGGVSGGTDKDDMSRIRVNNVGWFAEADGMVSSDLGVGSRFDYFDPNDETDDNTITAVSVFANRPLNNGIQLIGEYRYKNTDRGPSTSQTENSGNLRLIYIW